MSGAFQRADVERSAKSVEEDGLHLQHGDGGTARSLYGAEIVSGDVAVSVPGHTPGDRSTRAATQHTAMAADLRPVPRKSICGHIGRRIATNVSGRLLSSPMKEVSDAYANVQ